MTRTFDLVVVGSGSAAQAVAFRCQAAGWTVAMIDKRPFGGTCALRGCDPKKVLVSVASAANAARALMGKGIRADDLAIDWADLMAFKRTFTDTQSARLNARLAAVGIESVDGPAQFIGRSTLVVGGTMLEATRAIVLAVGARPADLPIPGRQYLITSDQFLELPSLPRSMTFVGGGFISFEFAHVAARAGVRVAILHRGERPLTRFDADLVDQLVAATSALNIDVRLGTEVVGVEREGEQYRVQIRDGRGDSLVESDLIVHGAGRVPDVDDLSLEAGSVRHSAAGVEVNEYLQSVSNPMVWAAGDCAASGGPRLTPAAAYDGRIVAANLLEGRSTPIDYRRIPSVVFTVAPLARVGLNEDEARAAGVEVEVQHAETSLWQSSRRAGDAFPAFKIVVAKQTKQILGAHLFGAQADETINLFALAMRAGVTADQFKRILWAYPTHASDTSYMVGA